MKWKPKFFRFTLRNSEFFPVYWIKAGNFRNPTYWKLFNYYSQIESLLREIYQLNKNPVLKNLFKKCYQTNFVFWGFFRKNKRDSKKKSKRNIVCTKFIFLIRKNLISLFPFWKNYEENSSSCKLLKVLLLDFLNYT